MVAANSTAEELIQCDTVRPMWTKGKNDKATVIFMNSPSLTELELQLISNCGGKSSLILIPGFFSSLFFSSFFFVAHFSRFTSASHRCGKAPVSVCLLYVPPFPRCIRSEVPSAGFLLSPLRGPQRLLIIPDLLALHPFSSRSGPLQLARPSSLRMRRLPCSVCPLERSK